MDLKTQYISICQAVTQLFPGEIEVVLHDLETETVAHVENPISVRKIGEESLVDLEQLKKDAKKSDVLGPYTRTNSDGSRLKSISVVLRDTTGQPKTLMCLNLRLQKFDEMMRLLDRLFELQETPVAESLLVQDWRERVNECVQAVLQRQGIPIQAAKRDTRLQIVAEVDAAGVFQIRNSADYVARVIGVSRATLYDMLKEHKEQKK
ncbi:hypothetical protein BWR17_19355 (plasmid) [Phaeobacter inhibens]|uniref:helix-turn-helix transcriptional regulator n=1 Tax=Phaeobacter inhibens TaxID=221822 RepID=UPI000971ACC8|nr:PAS domain-containing protein [Phaeobacter inhibens]APX18043.1 hypothetical protein BWR17_19355 [Phaeobacter inhibens]